MARDIQEGVSELEINDANEFKPFVTIEGHEKHPFISKEKYSDYQSSPDELGLLDKIGKKEFNSLNSKYSLKANEHVSSSEEKEELRIVLIGKTGVGKSAAGNAILGDKCFEEGITAMSVTKKSMMQLRKINGRLIRVIDTPGLHDTHKPKDEIFEEIARVMKVFWEGVHAFIYVQDISNPRFTKENKETLEMIEEAFGGDIKDFRLLVYSKADTMVVPTLDDFCKAQMQDDKQEITQFLRELDWKVVALNSKTTIPAERKRNQEIIIAMVDMIMQANCYNVYTSEMFKEAEKKRKELEEKGKQKGWNEAVMEAVDAVIAADPDITKDKKKFQMFIQKHLEGKRDEAERELLEARRKREEEERSRICREKEEERKMKEKTEREREERRLQWEREKEEKERKYRAQLAKIAEQKEQDQRNWILQQQDERMKQMEREWKERLQTEREEARVMMERQQKLQERERERARKERERMIKENELQMRRAKQALEDANTARQAAEVAKEHDGLLNGLAKAVNFAWTSLKGLFQ